MALTLHALRPQAPIVLRASSEASDFQLPPALGGVVAPSSRSTTASPTASGRRRTRRPSCGCARRSTSIASGRVSHRVPGPRSPCYSATTSAASVSQALRSAWEPEGVEIRVVGRHGDRVGRARARARGRRHRRRQGPRAARGDGLRPPRLRRTTSPGPTAGSRPTAIPRWRPRASAVRATAGRRPRADARRPRRLRPAMGLANRDLVIAHHSARRHAEQLMAALAAWRRGPRRPDGRRPAARDGPARPPPAGHGGAGRGGGARRADRARGGSPAALPRDAADHRAHRLRTQREAVEVNTREATEIWADRRAAGDAPLQARDRHRRPRRRAADAAGRRVRRTLVRRGRPSSPAARRSAAVSTSGERRRPPRCPIGDGCQIQDGAVLGKPPLLGRNSRVRPGRRRPSR